jgi:cell division control protein 45
MALQRAVIRQGSSLIDKQSIRSFRTFRLAVVKEGPDLALFAHPGILSRLALWLVDAQRERAEMMNAGKGKRKHLPLVVACLDEKAGSYLIVGVTAPPEYGDVRKK